MGGGRAYDRTVRTVLWLAAVMAGTMVLGQQRETRMKNEAFDCDPGWEGHNNRIVPKEYPTIAQNFGFSSTHFAGKSLGEMGGVVWRAAEPAYYADNIGRKTLQEKLSASGTFALTQSSGSSGIFFGFFRAQQPGAGGRPVSSLGLDMDAEGRGGRLAVRLITEQNQSCGTFITPFIPGKFRPTPIRNDGTRYHWKLDYDPEGAEGRGRFTFMLQSDAHKPGELEKDDLPESYRQEARRRFPSRTNFSVDLPGGFKEQGTVFDHFGLMNLMKPGGHVTIYFDDLEYLGRSQDFSREPNWDGSGNRATYRPKDVLGAHNFGFSDTSFAGGKPGEVGGTFWRSGNYAYYADRVGLLTLEDRLEASGKVVLKVGAPDSDMYMGWFDSADKRQSPAEAGNFIGVHVGGPTRVGHYFHPAYSINSGARAVANAGPLLMHDKVYEWSLIYDPAAEGGKGSIQVKLGDESTTLALRNGHNAQGVRFNRFGLFTSNIGGQIVKVYFDDLKYSVGAP